MDKDWCALTWGRWVPLERYAIIRTGPAVPGVYRIRRQGGVGNRLVYIGQTGRTLRSVCSHSPLALTPSSVPLTTLTQRRHPLAHATCAPVAGAVQVLRGTEDMLLWRHRIDIGVSTEANCGPLLSRLHGRRTRWIVPRGRSSARTPGGPTAPHIEGTPGVDFFHFPPTPAG